MFREYCSGIKLCDVSKNLGKKFAIGAFFVKGPIEKEQIDVRGDIFMDIVELITETWPDVREAEEAVEKIMSAKKQKIDVGTKQVVEKKKSKAKTVKKKINKKEETSG